MKQLHLAYCYKSCRSTQPICHQIGVIDGVESTAMVSQLQVLYVHLCRRYDGTLRAIGGQHRLVRVGFEMQTHQAMVYSAKAVLLQSESNKNR